MHYPRTQEATVVTDVTRMHVTSFLLDSKTSAYTSVILGTNQLNVGVGAVYFSGVLWTPETHGGPGGLTLCDWCVFDPSLKNLILTD